MDKEFYKEFTEGLPLSENPEISPFTPVYWISVLAARKIAPRFF